MFGKVQRETCCGDKRPLRVRRHQQRTTQQSDSSIGYQRNFARIVDELQESRLQTTGTGKKRPPKTFQKKPYSARRTTSGSRVQDFEIQRFLRTREATIRTF